MVEVRVNVRVIRLKHYGMDKEKGAGKAQVRIMARMRLRGCEIARARKCENARV